MNKFSQNDGQQLPTPRSVAEELLEASAEQSFESLDELNDNAGRIMAERNNRLLADFCGLSPEQMSDLLYKPFASPETVRFCTEMAPVAGAGILRLFLSLAEAIGENGLKPTAKGNLPLKLCKAIAVQQRAEASDDFRRRIGGIRSETDVDDLHCTRLTAELAGLVRKYRGKFVLTRKGRDLLDAPDRGPLYFALFEAYVSKFNWGYRDGYPEAELIQGSAIYTLFLLHAFGAESRSQRFYEDKFLSAFPMATKAFTETSYYSSEQGARQCYFLRALERFACFFGLGELELESQEGFERRYTLRKTELLDRLVSFSR